VSSGRAGSDQLKAHTRTCGVFGLLFAVLLVSALILIEQSPRFLQLESGILFVAMIFVTATFHPVSDQDFELARLRRHHHDRTAGT
jgi:hypothetical protein